MLAKIAGFTVVSWVLMSRVLPPLIALFQRVIQVPQLALGLLLGVLFLMGFGAEVMGLHGSLGALLFGASLSGLSYHVRREILPGLRSVADGLFVPLILCFGGIELQFLIRSLAAMDDGRVGADPAVWGTLPVLSSAPTFLASRFRTPSLPD